ncbi:MAG: NAD kinase [Prevotella sp.]|nr:NAD kinase [Prevotella sp.]
MPQKKLRFAIFGNIYQAKKSVSIQKILSFLSEKKAVVCVDREFYEFLTNGLHIDVKVDRVFEGDDFEADYVISMGGDGTFLKAASRVGAKGIPIVGVNMGRLGFLADVGPSEIEHALSAIYAGDYKIEEHVAIMVETEGVSHIAGCPYALNDIAVLKRDNASMISIRTAINGEHLVNYLADGLIVSTPTGSTAYSLSNGGPIIAPQAGVLCLSPVAPHSLNVRPIVVPDDAVVRLRVESRNHNFLVAIDGRSEKCAEGTTLTIRKAPYQVRIIKRNTHKYFHTLREKMMWGADTR